MKNTKNIIALAAIAAAAFTGMASAANQSPSQETWFGAEPMVAGPALSRAEVLADLTLWVRAGLDLYRHGESSSFDAAYDQRMAQYLQMRNGAQYQEELRRLGGVAK